MYCDAFDECFEVYGFFDVSIHQFDWEEPSFYPSHPWDLLIIVHEGPLHLNHIYRGIASQVMQSDFTLKTVVRHPFLRTFHTFFEIITEVP